MIKILTFAMLVGSLSIASANHHEEETITLDNLADAFGWDFDATPISAEKVADGLYVLFGVGGNIGVSVGEDGVLVVDDQFPQVMGKIEDAIKKIGGMALTMRSIHTGTSITRRAIFRWDQRVPRL